MSEPLDPPPFMEPGSNGKVVDRVLAFLDQWATSPSEDLGPTGIKLDGHYGRIGVGWMEQYQAAHGLSADGGCGPETRKQMRLDGFDFVAEAKALGKDDGIMSFRQPGGVTLYWAPGIEPTPSLEAASRAFDGVHARI